MVGDIPKSHKALMLKQIGVLTPEEVRTPIPTGDGVLIKVIAAGICHSDIHRWKGNLPCQEDRLAGAGTHEVVGTIVARGERVPDYYKEGEKVLVYPLGLYPEDDKYTLRGFQHHSEQARAAGFGGMQEYLLLQHYRCLVSVEGLADVPATAPLVCAGLTAFGAVKKVKHNLESDGHVAVVGLGGLGLYAVQWVKILMPYVNLIGIDIKEGPLELASKLTEMDVLINAAKEDPLGVIKDVTKGEGISAVIDFVGTTKTVGTYMNLVSNLGIYVIVGIMGNEVVLPALPTLVAKEITIRGSFMGSLTDQYKVVELARRKLLNYSDVVTKRLKFDAEEVNKGFKDLDEGEIIGRQIVILS